MERRQQVNGGGPPGSGQQQASSSGTKMRMPTVHDALPFTPFSSIIPLNSGQSAFTCCTFTAELVTRPMHSRLMKGLRLANMM